MSEFLVLLLMQVTIFSSVTALIILAVKNIFNCRIPPKIGMLMWIVLLARLLFPVLPESRVSVYNLIPVGRNIMYTMTYDLSDRIEHNEMVRDYSENPYIVHTTSDEEKMNSEYAEKRSNRSESISLGTYLSSVVDKDTEEGVAEQIADITDNTILAVYLIGIAVSISVNVNIYVKAKKRALFASSPCDDSALLKIYKDTGERLGIDEKILPPLLYGHSSMLLGCISPRVICCEGLSRREAAMTFAHELNHFKYRDNPILLFSTIVACLFWYNPLLWIVRSKLRDDVEVLCDERTLRFCGIAGTEYAFMLCRNSDFGELCNFAAGCYMSTSGRKLKNRLRTISHAKNRKFLPRIASAAMCFLIVSVCLTNPVISQNSEYDSYIENYSSLTGDDKRVMRLSSKVTVSSYLDQICNIIDDLYGEEFKSIIGNGSLEKLKRICAENKYVSNEIYAELRRLKTDEVLTNKSIAIVNECLVSLISENSEVRVPLVPRVVRESDMNNILGNLTSAEAEALLACYNKGTHGADIEFSYVYTDAMMELINKRLNNEWHSAKLGGFYTKINVGQVKKLYNTTKLKKVIENVREDEILYICTSELTKVEEMRLRKIISAAEAGAQGDVYYLKPGERSISDDILELLFKRGGFNLDLMYEGYAEISETDFEYLSEADYNVMTDIELDEIEMRIMSCYPDIGKDIHSFYENISDPHISDCYEPRGEYCYFSLLDEYSDDLGDIAEELNKVSFTAVRDDKCVIYGAANDAVVRAVERAYRLGLIDYGKFGTIDLADKISCGQSLYYAYRLVCSMVNVNK